MATGPFNTTTGAVFNPALLSAAVQISAENARVFRPFITEIPFGGPGKTLDILKIGGLVAAAYTEGTARTFSNNTETAVTITPAEIDLAMSFTDKQMKRSFLDLLPLYTGVIARSVAVKMDDDIAAEYAGSTGTASDQGGAVVTATKLIAAIGNVKVAAKDQGGVVNAVLHTTAWEDLILDDKVIAASQRGTGGLMTGEMTLIGGSRIGFTTSVVTVAGAPSKYQNMVFTPRAFAIVMKSELLVEAWDSRDNKAFRIACGADYDVATVFGPEASLFTVNV